MVDRRPSCCLCLEAAVLPVRPHASAYVRCVVVMCRECYRAWRHRHRTQPVPLLCPCCREPVYPGDVPPDALLVALTADLPVRCEACGSTVEHGALEAHRAEECSRLAMRRMIEVHRPPNTTTLTAVAAAADWWWCQATQEAWEGDDHPCCAHPAAGCQWAHVVRRLLVHPEVATDLGDHLRDVFGGFPTADALRRCAPVCDLMRSALPPDAVVDPVRLLLQGYHRGPPLSVLILVHRWLVTGGGRGIALLVEAAREHLVHTIRTDPHRAPEWMTPAAAGLLGELRGVLTELLLHDHDTTFTVTEFHVDLWLHGWKHGLLGDVPTSDADHHQQIMWARYWQAANPEQRAECVLLVMAHEGGWPPSIQGLLLGWWSAADVPVVAGEQLPPPLSWSRASALVLATHARGEASCSSWLQEFAQQPHPASANVLLYAMVCHHPHRADPVWQALVRSHLLVPLLRHLSDTATCPPISVPPVLLMPPLARGAVPQLDPAIACLRLQGEHLLLCLHRRLPQEDVPWTATWFGYFLLYLSAGGSIPALRRMRIGRSHNDTLVRSLWAVLQRPPPWWPSDTRAFLPALVAVLLPSRCPTEGWSVLRSALTGIGTDDDLTVAERRDLDPAVEALVYDTNPQLLDVGLFPTLSLLMRAGLLQGGSRTLVAVRRILLAVPVADWTADRVDRVRACGCASLTDALAYQWVGAAATDPVVCDRLLCPTEPDPDADTTATPFLVARILLHLEKGALLPVWVAAKATTSSPVDDLVACFRPEPAPPRRIHRLLQHVYGLLEDAACEAFPWWMQWHEAVVGHPKQTRASLVVHIIERLLRRFLWGGLSPTRPRPRPLPVDLEQRLLELVHQHPVHMFLLLVVGGWRAHAPLEDVCHEWWAQRPERLSQFVAAWLSDGDTPHTTLLMAFQQTAATHPLWVLRSVTLAGLVRSGKCMGCFVDAIEGLWIQYRNPAWAVADVTQLGRELLLGTVRQRWLVPWAQTDSCFATHTHTRTRRNKRPTHRLVVLLPDAWFRLLLDAPEFGPLYTLMTDDNVWIDAKEEEEVWVALSTTLHGLAVHGAWIRSALHHDQAKYQNANQTGVDSMVTMQVDDDVSETWRVPSEVSRCTAKLLDVCARHPSPWLRTGVLYLARAVHADHLGDVEASVVLDLLRAYASADPDLDQACASLLEQWIHTLREEARSSLLLPPPPDEAVVAVDKALTITEQIAEGFRGWSRDHPDSRTAAVLMRTTTAAE